MTYLGLFDVNIDLEFDIESEYKSRLKFWDANGNRNSSLGFIPLWFIKDIQGEPAKVGSYLLCSRNPYGFYNP